MSREGRQPAQSVQVETVIARRPSLADVAALEHDGLLTASLQHRGANKARGPRSDDCDHTRFLHDACSGPGAQRQLGQLAVEALGLLQVGEVPDALVP